MRRFFSFVLAIVFVSSTCQAENEKIAAVNRALHPMEFLILSLEKWEDVVNLSKMFFTPDDIAYLLNQLSKSGRRLGDKTGFSLASLASDGLRNAGHLITFKDWGAYCDGKLIKFERKRTLRANIRANSQTCRKSVAGGRQGVLLPYARASAEDAMEFFGNLLLVVVVVAVVTAIAVLCEPVVLLCLKAGGALTSAFLTTLVPYFSLKGPVNQLAGATVEATKGLLKKVSETITYAFSKGQITCLNGELLVTDRTGKVHRVQVNNAALPISTQKLAAEAYRKFNIDTNDMEQMLRQIANSSGSCGDLFRSHPEPDPKPPVGKPALRSHDAHKRKKRAVH